MAEETLVPEYEIILVSFNSASHVKELLGLMRPDQPIAVVDNAKGADELPSLLADREGARYVAGEGRGFAHAANLGVNTSSFDVVVFVNPDSRPPQSALDEIVTELVAYDAIGAVAVATRDAEGMPEMGVGGWEPSISRAFVHAVGLHKYLPRRGIWAKPQLGEPISLEWMSAAVMAIRRDVFLRLGGWDETFFVYNEDMALGHALRDSGLVQIMRTDLDVPHATGGSGAGSTFMMRVKGASLKQYLWKYHAGSSRYAIWLLLVAGSFARAAAALARGNRPRAVEFLVYTGGLLRGKSPDRT
jgi:N-acetylglucosaminyl-diphospho-decaprenol L-rhamnosyltransferase